MATFLLLSGETCVVDDEDVERIQGYRWRSLRRADGRLYVVAYQKLNRKTRTVYLHRFLMNAPPDMEVDHRDHDTLNNGKGNLRVVTHAQNTLNRRQYSNNRSGLKGAYWDRSEQRFRSQIFFQGKKRSLGYFPTAEEAHQAYVAAANRLHGEFACAS